MMLTDEQIEQGFVVIVGILPRSPDMQVVKLLGGTEEVLAEYLWDHWLGEPERPTQEEILAAMRSAWQTADVS